MPLLGKEEFHLKSLPTDLLPDQEIFYCQITGEAFLSYDEYFERQFLYSSLLWTCSLTGRTGLTYSEALKSEQECRQLVSTIPRVLQKVLLHLMNTYMNNFSTNVTLSILIEYTNLRYFIGESVQIKQQRKRIQGIIRDVIPPNDENLTTTTTSIAYGLDPLSYNYIVETDNERIIIPAARISRSKFLLTREKIRLFLRQHLAPKTGRYDSLTIKTESLRKFGIDQLCWSDIFKGPTPNFTDDTMIVKALSRQRLLMNDCNDQGVKIDGENQENEQQQQGKLLKRKKSNLLSSQKQKLMNKRSGSKPNDKKRQQQKNQKKDSKGKKQKKKKNKKKSTNDNQDDQESGSKQESKRKEDLSLDYKNRERELRKQFEEDLRNWNEKRDDLLCDDLLPLPGATPIEFDNELIGDSFVIVDFLNVFHLFISFDNTDNIELSFPEHLTFDYFLKILMDNNVEARGGISDLLISLMKTIFSLNHNSGGDQDDHDLQINESDQTFDNNEDVDNNNGGNSHNGSGKDGHDINCLANYFVTTYFSTIEQLRRLPLDAYTITEILRIYILKTRNYPTTKSQQMIKISAEDMTIVIKLSTNTVFELNPTDRIQIIKILLTDIVTKSMEIRQKIETTMDEMVKLKIQIRHLNAAHQRWLRENPIRQRIRRKKTTNSDDDLIEQLTKEEKEQYKKDKQERERKMKENIAELKAKIRHLSSYSRLRPIGMDRKFRKYWLFDSIPGLFVEQLIPCDDNDIDNCDELNNNQCFDNPIPKSKPILEEYLANLKKRNKKSQSVKDVDATTVTMNSEVNTVDRCTGNPITCTIHRCSIIQSNNYNRRKFKHLWSFYTKDEFDALIDALNNRGYRESELKQALLIEKKQVMMNHLNEFDPLVFNANYVPTTVEMNNDSTVVEENSQMTIRKSERILDRAATASSNKRSSSNRTTRNEFRLEFNYEHEPMELFDRTFQNELTIFENNVFNACFCSFSISDREEWYQQLTSNNQSQNQIESLKILTEKFSTLARSIRPFCLMPPLSVYTTESTMEKENINDNTNQSVHKFRVPQLSEKWLDVLKVPPDFDLIESALAPSNYGITNHSQLFLNLYIFERSINWEMSALKTANKCNICRRRANDEMILCDFCNHGYHIYCLTPPIASVNEIEGDWYCPKCLPRDHKKSANATTNNTTKIEPEPEQQQKHKSTIEVDIVDDNVVDVERCKSCRKHIFNSFSEVSCKTCGEHFHLQCVNLIRIPRSWNCTMCVEKEHDDEQYNNHNNNHQLDNCGGELRRSQRKRKPNHYHEYEPNDHPHHHYHYNSNNYQSANQLKTRRCSSDGRNSQDYHRIVVK